MAFGNNAPPATPKQVQYLLSLVQKAGHADFRDARGPLQLTQRQAGGKFSKNEASALIDQLLAEPGGTGGGDEDGGPSLFASGEQISAADRLEAERASVLRGMPAGLLAAELERARLARRGPRMSKRSAPAGKLDDIGERDGWRCWVCDEVVDPAMSVNDDRGPSIDSRSAKPKGKGSTDPVQERLAHRGCNTKKGAVAAVIAWPDHLFVVDPAPILGSVERLSRKGGREVMARCPTAADADEAGTWLVDRISRLRPDLRVATEVERGGGQFLLVLRM